MLHHVCLLTNLFCEKTVGSVVVNSVNALHRVYISLLWESRADGGTSQGQPSAILVSDSGTQATPNFRLHLLNTRAFLWLPWQKRKIRHLGGVECLIPVGAIHISLDVTNHRGLSSDSGPWNLVLHGPGKKGELLWTAQHRDCIPIIFISPILGTEFDNKHPINVL